MTISTPLGTTALAALAEGTGAPLGVGLLLAFGLLLVGAAHPGRADARSPSATCMARRRPATAPAVDPALAMDLVAAALEAGAPVSAALAVVAQALGEGDDGSGDTSLGRASRLMAMGAEPEVAWAEGEDHWAPMARCLALAQASGAPTAGLLRQAAHRVRTDRALRRTAAAHRLGVRVLLPLGLCALPGFAALGVAPVVLALAGSLLR